MTYFFWFSRTALLAIGLGWLGSTALAGNQPSVSLAVPAIDEQFNDLDHWHPLTFPLQSPTDYRMSNGVLEARSADSVSALVSDRIFEPEATPMLSWRWKVDNIYARGDARQESGDDFPLRVSVCFQLDPKKVSANERRWFKMQKLVWGEYPPYRVLHYVYANRDDLPGRTLPCPYSERARIVVQRHGNAELGQWLEENVDIMADYRTAFGEEPPREAVISVMSDSDNTEESSTAYLDWIRVTPRLP